jgi:hypothetical protein
MELNPWTHHWQMSWGGFITLIKGQLASKKYCFPQMDYHASHVLLGKVSHDQSPSVGGASYNITGMLTLTAREMPGQNISHDQKFNIKKLSIF